MGPLLIGLIFLQKNFSAPHVPGGSNEANGSATRVQLPDEDHTK
jgi:hypothetical protein